MKFLVTGGAGFIGNNIVRLLLKSNHDVDIIDNLHTGKIENIRDILNKINFFKIDIRNRKELEKIINNYDGIFHEAALTAVPESFEKPKEYNDVNVIGTKNIFDIADKIMLLGESKIIAEGTPSQILRSPKAKELYFGETYSI